MTEDLSRAAQRAREVLPPPIARLVEDELRRGIAGASYQWHEPYAPLAAAVLALPVSALDRTAVASAIHSAWCPLLPQGLPCDTDLRAADALISVGLVRGPVTAEQVHAAADLFADEHYGKEADDVDVDLVRRILQAAGLSVEGDETHG